MHVANPEAQARNLPKAWSPVIPRGSGISVILGLYNIGIMEKKMETTRDIELYCGYSHP